MTCSLKILGLICGIQQALDMCLRQATGILRFLFGFP